MWHSRLQRQWWSPREVPDPGALTFPSVGAPILPCSTFRARRFPRTGTQLYAPCNSFSSLSGHTWRLPALLECEICPEYLRKSQNQSVGRCDFRFRPSRHWFSRVDMEHSSNGQPVTETHKAYITGSRYRLAVYRLEWLEDELHSIRVRKLVSPCGDTSRLELRPPERSWKGRPPIVFHSFCSPRASRSPR